MLGAASTVHDRFWEWTKQGVFEKLWRSSLLEYDERKGICWQWQSLDGAITKAPLGGESTIQTQPIGIKSPFGAGCTWRHAHKNISQKSRVKRLQK